MHRYTSQMAYIHLIYTIFPSQTALIQQYKPTHVNLLLPRPTAASSPPSSPELGHLVVLHPSVQPLPPQTLSSLSRVFYSFRGNLCGWSSEPGLALCLFQNIPLSRYGLFSKTVSWIIHMCRLHDPADGWFWNSKCLLILDLCIYCCYPYDNLLHELTMYTQRGAKVCLVFCLARDSTKEMLFLN